MKDYNFEVGEVIYKAFSLKEFSVLKTRNEDPYLRGVLSTRDQEFPFVYWDFKHVLNQDETLEELRATTFVWVEAEVGVYEGDMQMTLSNIEAIRIDDERIEDPQALIKTTNINVREAFNEMMEYASNMSNTDYSLIVTMLLDENKINFLNYPAAMSVHHEYKGGLIEHTYEMFTLAKNISKSMINQDIDEELIVSGAILHDLMKTREYEVNGAFIATGVSQESLFMGDHIIQIADEIKRVGYEYGVDQKSVQKLVHMVLSHHGELEFGAVVKPAFKEAMILHYIDQISSKAKVFDERAEEGVFSEKRDYVLGSRITKV